MWVTLCVCTYPYIAGSLSPNSTLPEDSINLKLYHVLGAWTEFFRSFYEFIARRALRLNSSLSQLDVTFDHNLKNPNKLFAFCLFYFLLYCWILAQKAILSKLRKQTADLSLVSPGRDGGGLPPPGLVIDALRNCICNLLTLHENKIMPNSQRYP